MWHGIILVIARLMLWTWRPPPRHYIYVAVVALTVITAVVGAERLGFWPEAWKVNSPAGIPTIDAKPMKSS